MATGRTHLRHPGHVAGQLWNSSHMASSSGRFSSTHRRASLTVRWVPRRIAGPALGEVDLEVDARYALDSVDHLEHREAAAVAAIERHRGAAATQIGKRVGMRAHQVGHVDVVADAGAVRCRVVGAEYVHL